MSLLLSAQSGEVVTPAQLLGEGEEEQAARLDQAEKDAEVLTQKMIAAGIA
ncbi:MAG TPA: hypothetical protein VFG23_22610 [Polyangia bacterium]|nr:hypothetical protein [Polyangia bacterium]